MLRICLVALVAILSGCGDDATPMDSSVPDASLDADGTDAPSDAGMDAGRDATGCTDLWTVDDPGSAEVTLTVDLGELEIRAMGLPTGPNTQIIQSGLLGDFDATFEVAGFEAGFGGFYVQAKARKPDGSEALAALGSSPEQSVATVITEPALMDTQATTGTAAMLRLQRSGDTLTVTATSGSDTASVSGPFDGELEIGLQVGNNGAVPIDDPSRVRVLGFVIAPEGTVRSDAFDCDSLVRR